MGNELVLKAPGGLSQPLTTRTSAVQQHTALGAKFCSHPHSHQPCVLRRAGPSFISLTLILWLPGSLFSIITINFLVLINTWASIAHLTLFIIWLYGTNLISRSSPANLNLARGNSEFEMRMLWQSLHSLWKTVTFTHSLQGRLKQTMQGSSSTSLPVWLYPAWHQPWLQHCTHCIQTKHSSSLLPP